MGFVYFLWDIWICPLAKHTLFIMKMLTHIDCTIMLSALCYISWELGNIQVFKYDKDTSNYRCMEKRKYLFYLHVSILNLDLSLLLLLNLERVDAQEHLDFWNWKFHLKVFVGISSLWMPPYSGFYSPISVNSFALFTKNKKNIKKIILYKNTFKCSLYFFLYDRNFRK